MPDSNQYSSTITNNLTANIAASASLSDTIDLSGTILIAYIMPAAWTAADITFQASGNGIDFYNLYDQFGNELRHTVAQSRFIALNPADMASIRYLKIRSGTSASAVNQASQRQISLVTKAL